MRSRGRLRVLAEREVMSLLEEASTYDVGLARLRRELFRRLRKVERHELLRLAQMALVASMHPDLDGLAAVVSLRAEGAAEVRGMASLIRARVHLFEAARLVKSAKARPEVRRRVRMLVAAAGRNLGWAWEVYRPTWRLNPWAFLFLLGFPAHGSMVASKPVMGRYRVLRPAVWPGADN
ncbi:MAG: hypothetical protein IMX02_01705 [Limnochordaceae bacterium]|nr:hypothetical protein [Limnochordaceae bacterium]